MRAASAMGPEGHAEPSTAMIVAFLVVAFGAFALMWACCWVDGRRERARMRPVGRFVALMQTAHGFVTGVLPHQRFARDGLYALVAAGRWSAGAVDSVVTRFSRAVTADARAPLVALGRWGRHDPDPLGPAVAAGWTVDGRSCRDLRIIELYPPHVHAPAPPVPGAIVVLTNENCDDAWRNWVAYTQANWFVRALCRLTGTGLAY
jgi:hypothetical protein